MPRIIIILKLPTDLYFTRYKNYKPSNFLQTNSFPISIKPRSTIPSFKTRGDRQTRQVVSSLLPAKGWGLYTKENLQGNYGGNGRAYGTTKLLAGFCGVLRGNGGVPALQSKNNQYGGCRSGQNSTNE